MPIEAPAPLHVLQNGHAITLDNVRGVQVLPAYDGDLGLPGGPSRVKIEFANGTAMILYSPDPEAAARELITIINADRVMRRSPMAPNDSENENPFRFPSPAELASMTDVQQHESLLDEVFRRRRPAVVFPGQPPADGQINAAYPAEDA